MRLGTCVALELMVGASMLAGLGVSVTFGVHQARSYWQGEARAAAIAHGSRERLAPPTRKEQGDEPGQRAGAALQPASIDPAVDEELAPADQLAEQQIELAVAALAPAAKAIIAGQVPGPELAMAAAPARLPTITVADSGDQDEDDASPVTVSEGVDEPSVPASYYGVFNGVRDDLLLAPLRHATIKRVKFNRGGSSISLRIDFDNGARAAFKPDQTAMHTVPRKEIAAYRVNRLLGLDAVPPAIGRELAVDELLGAVLPSSQVFLPRLREEMRVRNGKVTGELSWWIPVILRAKIEGYEIDSTDGIVTWKRYLTVGKEIPEPSYELLSQISSMVLFDFIINNPDRWSGANARVSEDGRTLYFMDNTMSFGVDGDGHRKCRIYLRRSQKFSRSLVAALRDLTGEQIRAIVAEDKGPYDVLLTEPEIATLLERRGYALAYIDELIAEHGENAVLVFR